MRSPGRLHAFYRTVRGAVATWRLRGTSHEGASLPLQYRLHWLERQFRGQLECAWAAGTEDLTDTTGRLAEGDGLRRRHRIERRAITGEVRDVEDVECLAD